MRVYESSEDLQRQADCRNEELVLFLLQSVYFESQRESLVSSYGAANVPNCGRLNISWRH